MLTDNEIKKALECAIRNNCDCNCVFLLPNKVQDVLDLINRLQTKIEHYKKSRDKYQDNVMYLSKQCDELQAENERLRKECGNQSALWSKHYEDIFETAKETIKTEAYKKCIEKVKNIITEIYNKHIFGSNDLTDEEKDAVLMRHICKWLKDPHGKDEDSGLPHLWHIACNVAFLLELDKDE